MSNIIVYFFRTAIRFATVFLFGSTGETITEKSGHLNLGTPGVMCIGAFGGCGAIALYLSAVGGSANANGFLVVLIGILACLLCGGLSGALYSFFTVTLKCNQNVTGLTLTTFGIGLNSFGFSALAKWTRAMAEATPSKSCYIANVSQYFNNLFKVNLGSNWFLDIFCSHGILVYLAIIISVLAAVFINYTRIGLNLKAVGENPATADAAGINVTGYRYVFTIIGCAIASLGGLFFIMDFLGGNIEYKIDEYGWLAVAIVIFSMWKPDIGIIGSFIFSALYIAPQCFAMSTVGSRAFALTPYILTIIVLIVVSLFNKKNVQPPEGLGLSYDREKR